MAQAFSCDTCGECVRNQSEALSTWTVASSPANISGTAVTLNLNVEVDVGHMCETCRQEAKDKIKAWAATNL